MQTVPESLSRCIDSRIASRDTRGSVAGRFQLGKSWMRFDTGWLQVIIVAAEVSSHMGSFPWYLRATEWECRVLSPDMRLGKAGT